MSILAKSNSLLVLCQRFLVEFTDIQQLTPEWKDLRRFNVFQHASRIFKGLQVELFGVERKVLWERKEIESRKM